MLGFDTLYSNAITDERSAIWRIRGRIVLTRDRELLKRREITHGCFVRALKPSQQLREIVQRLQLDAYCLGRATTLPAAESLPSLPRRGAPGRCPTGDGVVRAGSHHPAGSAGTPPLAAPAGGEGRAGARGRSRVVCTATGLSRR